MISKSLELLMSKRRDELTFDERRRVSEFLAEDATDEDFARYLEIHPKEAVPSSRREGRLTEDEIIERDLEDDERERNS